MRSDDTINYHGLVFLLVILLLITLDQGLGQGLENIVCLTMRQVMRWLSVAQHPISFDSLCHTLLATHLHLRDCVIPETHITLRVDFHLGHQIIEFHILLPDSAAALHCLDALA